LFIFAARENMMCHIKQLGGHGAEVVETENTIRLLHIKQVIFIYNNPQQIYGLKKTRWPVGNTVLIDSLLLH
jgi:hypothetical protein